MDRGHNIKSRVLSAPSLSRNPYRPVLFSTVVAQPAPPVTENVTGGQGNGQLKRRARRVAISWLVSSVTRTPVYLEPVLGSVPEIPHTTSLPRGPCCTLDRTQAGSTELIAAR